MQEAMNDMECIMDCIHEVAGMNSKLRMDIREHDEGHICIKWHDVSELPPTNVECLTVVNSDYDDENVTKYLVQTYIKGSWSFPSSWSLLDHHETVVKWASLPTLGGAR